MILTRIKNEKSKTGFKNINKHVLFEFKCRFDVKKCNSSQKWNKDKYRCKCKNIPQKLMSAKKYIFGILLHVAVKTVDMQELLLAMQ